MRLVLAGTPGVALPALHALHASHHEVVAVLTRPDAATGRGRRAEPSAVAVAARELGLDVLTPDRPHDADFVARLTELEPDCCPVVAYGALIPEPVLAIPRHGWVNLHFSVLPAWRGAAPVQHAVMAGDEVTGATVFSLVHALDAGPVLGVLTERIGDTDTAGELLDRLSRHGARLLLDTLDHVEAGDITACAQPEDGASYAPKLTVDDARITWNQPAYAIDRRIRACTPEPGAWTTVGGDRLKLGPVRPAVDHPPLAPGALAVTKRNVHVGTATTPVLLGEVQARGKRPMPAADWARGVRMEGGARLD